MIPALNTLVIMKNLTVALLSTVSPSSTMKKSFVSSLSKNRWVSEVAGRDGVGMWFFISNNDEYNYGEMVLFELLV